MALANLLVATNITYPLSFVLWVHTTLCLKQALHLPLVFVQEHDIEDKVRYINVRSDLIPRVIFYGPTENPIDNVVGLGRAS